MTDTTGSSDEAQIREVIHSWVAAFRNRDVSAAKAIHSPDTVSFDIVPPLRYIGWDSYRKPWEDTFDGFIGPIDFEIRDLVITVGDDMAFSRSLNRMMGTMADGQKTDFWFRWTACFQKIGGRWLIVHDHTSVPTDFGTGTAVLDLAP
ncbi:nuclear transport factor 2 family protein [Nocardia sp. GTS18]|uniref:YybH family protein n=1 Tax=Nocardia sp. GTS18 TaxID=1778064 RepID=UPI0015EF1B70|nr:nuclear transport factor 2 family protein [Nocardia sp. GTS18]